MTPNEKYSACVSAAGYVPVPLTDDNLRRLLPADWRRVTDDGIRLGNRTYDSTALNPYRGMKSGLSRKKGRWAVHHHPYDLTRVWLYDHHEDTMVLTSFIHAGLIGAPFTQDIWDTALSLFEATSGDKDDEAGIARVVCDLLEQAWAGPTQLRPELEDGLPPFITMSLPSATPESGADAPEPDWATITPFGELDVDREGLYPIGHPALRPETPGSAATPALITGTVCAADSSTASSSPVSPASPAPRTAAPSVQGFGTIGDEDDL